MAFNGNTGDPRNERDCRRSLGPYRIKADVLRSELLNAVSVEDIQAVVKKLVDMAKEGNMAAIKLFLYHIVGNKPIVEATVHQENLFIDMHERKEREDEIAARNAIDRDNGTETCKHGENKSRCRYCAAT